MVGIAMSRPKNGRTNGAVFHTAYLHMIWDTVPASLLLQECPLVSVYPVADKNPPSSSGSPTARSSSKRYCSSLFVSGAYRL